MSVCTRITPTGAFDCNPHPSKPIAAPSPPPHPPQVGTGHAGAADSCHPWHTEGRGVCRCAAMRTCPMCPVHPAPHSGQQSYVAVARHGAGVYLCPGCQHRGCSTLYLGQGEQVGPCTAPETGVSYPASASAAQLCWLTMGQALPSFLPQFPLPSTLAWVDVQPLWEQGLALAGLPVQHLAPASVGVSQAGLS